MENTLFDGDRMVVLKQFSIERFDIVILRSEDKEKLYVKRVIGLPGVRIEYKNQQLWINGTLAGLNEEQYIKENTVMTDFLIEKVPENAYFVLGDNCNHSKGSRQIGFILQEDIIFKGFINILPLERIRIVN